MPEVQEIKFNPALFDPNEAQLREIVAEVSKITADPEKMTKEDLELISSTKNKLVKARTTIEKVGKNVREAANKFNKDVIAYEDSLIAIIEPEEVRLKELEKGAKEHAMKQERMKTLPEFKEKLAAIGDDFQITDEELLAFDPNQRIEHYNSRLSVKLEKDKIEADRKRAEEDAAKKEAEDKATKEKEAEAKKIQDEKDAIERDRNALVEKQFNFRMGQLLELGLKFNGTEYIKDDINVSIVEIKTDSDEDFASKVGKIKAEISRRDKIAAEEAEEKRQADIKEAAETAKRLAEEKAESDRVSDEKKRQDEAAEKEKEEQQKQAKEKAEADEREKTESYNNFLVDNGFNDQTDIVKFENGITILYRKVAEYKH